MVLTLLFFFHSFSQSGTLLIPEPVHGARHGEPICPSLPAHGLERQLSLFVAPTTDHPGIVCVRVYNGGPEWISYGWLSLRLERRWFGVVWSSVLHPKDLFPECQGCAVQPVLITVPTGSFRDYFMPSMYASVHAGTYRVRFRYRLAEQEEERTVYSEPFTVAPSVNEKKG